MLLNLYHQEELKEHSSGQDIRTRLHDRYQTHYYGTMGGIPRLMLCPSRTRSTAIHPLTSNGNKEEPSKRKITFTY